MTENNTPTTTHNEDEMRSLAQEFLTDTHNAVSAGQATVIGLAGDLGTGKTFWVRAMAEKLGITNPITSPTFVIAKFYEVTSGPWQQLIHIDAYRLESKTDLEKLGWAEWIADPKNLICIEWPELVSGALPDSAKNVKITWVDDTTREITLS